MVDVYVINASPELIHNWGWFLVFGVVLLLLGLAAIFRSVRATVVSMVFFGWLLVFASIAEFIHAFMVGNWTGFFLHLLTALLFGITGIVMAAKPLISAEAVTLLVSVVLLIEGLYQLIYAIWTHVPGWGWHALDGVVGAVLGGLLLAQWPVSGLWVIGLYIGIELVLYGWTWISLALALRKS
jgi:uncharacterized membrane protein HdeD (DUF308 family)